MIFNKMKIKLYISGLLLILAFTTLWAGEAEKVFEKANMLYNNERYAEAASLYQQLVDSDFEHPDLYYNLGNAYFKSNEIPKAIYYYEKARKLAPNDKEILHNIEIANRYIIDKPDIVPEPFYKVWWNTWLTLFTPNQWAVIALVLFNILFLLATIFFLIKDVKWKKISFYSGLIILVFTVFSFFFAYHSYKNSIDHSEAIIFSPSVVVKSSPNEKSVDLFVIHEGLKVKLLEDENGWTKIKIGNGKIGWIKDDDYRKI